MRLENQDTVLGKKLDFLMVLACLWLCISSVHREEKIFCQNNIVKIKSK